MTLTKNYYIEGKLVTKNTVIVIDEGKAVGNLYHFTTLDNLKSILKSDTLISSNSVLGEPSISFSRDSKGAISKLGRSTGKHVNPYGNIRLTIDGDQLSNRYAIRPFDYRAYNNSHLDNSEEIVQKNKIDNISNYILAIDISEKRYDKNEENWKQVKTRFPNFNYGFYKV